MRRGVAALFTASEAVARTFEGEPNRAQILGRPRVSVSTRGRPLGQRRPVSRGKAETASDAVNAVQLGLCSLEIFAHCCRPARCRAIPIFLKIHRIGATDCEDLLVLLLCRPLCHFIRQLHLISSRLRAAQRSANPPARPASQASRGKCLSVETISS